MPLLMLLVLPFLACLAIAGIHCYLGLHVVDRGIIFVDLALAQIASLGATVALLLGHDLHGTHAALLSLALTIVGAAAFALMRQHVLAVPQEALIGIVYAVASALAILVLDGAPHGQEEVKSMLVGNVLFVTAGDVVRLAVSYSLLGAFHFVFRRRFFLISRDVEAARAQGVNVLAWDFLFYLTFGLVIVQSVRIAGILLVFSYLVVPATCAVMLARTTRMRLAIGWALGLLGSVAGLFVSAKGDLPTGAAIVAAFGGILLAVLAAQPFVRSKRHLA